MLSIRVAVPRTHAQTSPRDRGTTKNSSPVSTASFVTPQAVHVRTAPTLPDCGNSPINCQLPSNGLVGCRHCAAYNGASPLLQTSNVEITIHCSYIATRRPAPETSLEDRPRLRADVVKTLPRFLEHQQRPNGTSSANSRAHMSSGYPLDSISPAAIVRRSRQTSIKSELRLAGVFGTNLARRVPKRQIFLLWYKMKSSISILAQNSLPPARPLKVRRVYASPERALRCLAIRPPPLSQTNLFDIPIPKSMEPRIFGTVSFAKNRSMRPSLSISVANSSKSIPHFAALAIPDSRLTSAECRPQCCAVRWLRRRLKMRGIASEYFGPRGHYSPS